MIPDLVIGLVLTSLALVGFLFNIYIVLALVLTNQVRKLVLEMTCGQISHTPPWSETWDNCQDVLQFLILETVLQFLVLEIVFPLPGNWDDCFSFNPVNWTVKQSNWWQPKTLSKMKPCPQPLSWFFLSETESPNYPNLSRDEPTQIPSYIVDYCPIIVSISASSREETWIVSNLLVNKRSLLLRLLDPSIWSIYSLGWHRDKVDEYNVEGIDPDRSYNTNNWPVAEFVGSEVFHDLFAKQSMLKLLQE